MIKVVGLERTKGMARLRFRAGSRVLNTLSRQLAVEAALNEVIALSPASSQSPHEQLSKPLRARVGAL